MQIIIRPIFLTSEFSNECVRGQIDVQVWPFQERQTRAFKMAAGCFGLAVASIFLPIAHFVLVPGFLIATPLIYYWIAKEEKTILSGQGACPSCSKIISISKMPYKFPILDICSHCRKSVKIDLLGDEIIGLSL